MGLAAMMFEDMIDALVNNYGLELLMEQNDLTEEDVIKHLVNAGLLDTEDYFYSDAEETIWELDND
uniref:Uncharacterized protein n=1 Tax=uncultured virus TaxID=340016 RepID=A0A0A0UXV9_9VIRU|nr:hypothetical protein [uncultured virus]